MLLNGIIDNKICCCLICLSLLLVSGCRASWPFAPARVESLPSPVEMKQYRQAVSAYQQKAYLEAAKSFEVIRTQTRDKRFALTALYGLALSKLMAAKTPKEYNDALLLWQRWVENVPAKFDYEDPVLAGDLIEEKMLFSNIPLSSEPVRMSTRTSGCFSISVIIKALARFSAHMTFCDHFIDQLGMLVARVIELISQCLHLGPMNVQSDHIDQLQRPHGMIGTEFHGLVHVTRLGHTRRHEPGRFV